MVIVVILLVVIAAILVPIGPFSNCKTTGKHEGLGEGAEKV